MNNTNNGHSSTKTQSPRTSSTLTLSIGIGNTAPGFPSPSSSLVPPPVVVPTEFASVKDKRKDENSRKNSKVGLNGVTKSNSQLDTKLNLSSPAVDPEFMISPTTPTPDSLHRQRSFPNSESLSAAVASVIELPTDLLTDHEAHYSSTNSAVKAFSAAASGDTQSPIIPMPPFSKPSSSSSHSLPKTPVRTPSNPPTPSSPGFYFPPPTSSRKPNRDSTMSNFSTSSAASAHSTTSLKSNRPAPPSPALSRRTSGVGANATASPIAKRFSTGPGGGVSATGAIDRSHSLRTSPTVSRTHSNSPKAALPMSSHPHRFSSPAFRRDSSTMAVPAPLPLTPVPGSASLPPGSNPLPSSGLSSASLSSAGLSSAALRTATTASTGLTKGKSTGITSQMRRPIRIRDYAYMAGGGPQDLLSLDALGDDDPRFLGLGTDGKGLHVPTPNRMKVLNKALLTATNMSAISSNLNATYTMWKMSYKRDRKERKAAAKRRAKDAKRERAHARYSMNSVRSVSSTSSIASSVSSTNSRSEVSDVDEREDDDEDDGMGGWAGFKFGLARLSWGFGNPGPTGTSASASSTSSKSNQHTTNKLSTSNTSDNPKFTSTANNSFPSHVELERNFGFDAASSESGDDSSNNSTDTEGEQFHDAPSHLRHADLDFGLDLEGRGLDSPSPLDYDRAYGYDEDAYGQIPNSAFPSASPYPGSGDGYGYEDDSLDSIGEGELIPGQYRALYSFEPEGPSEMKLTEGEIVKVIGRGGGGGWAVVVDKYGENSSKDAEGDGATNPTTTNKYALVPESYLELIQPDEVVNGEVKEESKMVPTPEEVHK